MSAPRAWLTESAGPDGPVPETVDGIAARVWDYTWPGPDSRRHRLDLAAWATERLAWRDRIFVEAGLRFERTTGAADGAAQGVAWTSLLPRVSARLRLTSAGRLSLVGGWAEYRHRLLLDALAFGDPSAPSASVYRWTDANGNGVYDAAERGDLVARVGPGRATGRSRRSIPACARRARASSSPASRRRPGAGSSASSASTVARRTSSSP